MTEKISGLIGLFDTFYSSPQPCWLSSFIVHSILQMLHWRICIKSVPPFRIIIILKSRLSKHYALDDLVPFLFYSLNMKNEIKSQLAKQGLISSSSFIPNNIWNYFVYIWFYHYILQKGEIKDIFQVSLLGSYRFLPS